MNSRRGVLYVCATPIGNLEDITLRALRVLKEADLIAAEDTRRTHKLLSFYDIHTPLTSYHAQSGQKKGRHILELLGEGKQVALVTDAGMPGISDPGEELVLLAIEQGIAIVPVPGPNAALTALVVSGLHTSHFCFEGFLPANSGSRKEKIISLKNEKRTLLFYEAPHRLLKTLENLLDCLGDRKIAVARELTKYHEQIWRGHLSEALEFFKAQSLPGEFTLVLEGAPVNESLPEKNDTTRGQKTDRESLAELVNSLKKKGVEQKTAIKEVARQYNLSKREVYAAVVSSKKK